MKRITIPTATCTECNHEIDYLVAIYTIEYSSKFNPNYKPKQYRDEKITGKVSGIKYTCPDCGKVITKDHSDAQAQWG